MAASWITWRSPARSSTVRGRRSCRRNDGPFAPEAVLAVAGHRRSRGQSGAKTALIVPRDQDNVIVTADGRDVRLTNLRKIFWPELGLTKGDLLRYYADVSDVLLPHIRNRAMVMKRYPHGAAGEFFFMKRAPSPRPAWIEICRIDHGSKGVIDFPMIQDLAALMWVINLGCIDLNQWYATCDDPDRPDYLHF